MPQPSAPEKPTAVHPVALPALEASHPAGTDPESKLLPSFQPLHQLRATLQVCVGSATLTVGELLNAQANQVLVLDRGLEQAVDLVLEGQVVARGQLVAVGDRFAVKLTELPVPLSLTPNTSA
ncbi:FliM/FliN family flagellar motor switch protein [Acidovorax sp. GBBC 3334]|uniref:FliM/FliN family flagellar motor switch protein n=1 Tax=Acidovorax sp. GBBC 3334 TaxID=2940496 RepID=UPI002302AAE6|nr:FliM/FliN family flagellar motor switch protein [Acidovorax sp. GBBC 3334]MDA8456966.1 FliM/FliN family flagellar motor switch protein [Acidovorax sp. GBBC 3334]